MYFLYFEGPLAKNLDNLCNLGIDCIHSKVYAINILCRYTNIVFITMS